MKIAVIFGGISPERNVSIAGGKAVIQALREKGHEVLPIDPAYGVDGYRNGEEIMGAETAPTNEELEIFNSKSYIDCINSEIFDDVDIAFIVLHGKYGEDGLIQSLLKLRGVPYTGSNVKSSANAIEKHASKMLFSAAGILTPNWLIVDPKLAENIDYVDDIRKELGNSLVIKPNDQGSTIGISMVLDGNLDDISEAIKEAAKFSDIVLIEQYIEGREITVGIVGSDALPVIEIIPEGGFYDYKHKYTKGHTTYECPADIPEDIAEFVMGQAQTAYSVLGCSGFGRADFRLDEDGQAWIMEVNTIPGFTATSLVPMAAKEIGIEFPDLCEKIINIALGKNEEEAEG